MGLDILYVESNHPSRNQIILYAKHWFKRTNLIEDLQVLIASRHCLLDPNNISVDDIMDVLTELTEKYNIKLSWFIRQCRSTKSCQDMNVDNGVKWTDQEISIHTMLTWLSTIEIPTTRASCLCVCARGL